MTARLAARPTASHALLYLAQLDGYRESSGPPGCHVLMHGHERLDDLIAGWLLCEGSKI